MRIKYDYRTASRETYNRFKTKFPEIDISYEDFKNVIYEYAEAFKSYILETGDVGKLPNGLGYFTVVKKKVKRYKNFLDKDGNPYINLPIDWKATREEGKRVYHMNFHTDGYKCRWFWHIGSSRIYLHTLLTFKPSRATSRLLASYLNKPSSIYIQMYHELINNRIR